MLSEKLKLKYMVKKVHKKNCSQCNGEKDFAKKHNIKIEAKHSTEAEKLLIVSINTPPLTLKELKAKLKKEREGKNGSK